jgi:demethylmenaquinone methyltransferase/2-methoxy-6-polyprenyl-1,4-benzoquinol methylase
MFNSIAPTYDRLNRTLSLGLDARWRRKAAESLRTSSPRTILDLAAGTADLSIEMARRLQPQRIVAADISEKMMEIGRRKVARAGLSATIAFELCDCLDIACPDNSYDAVTIAFGLRNLENLELAIAEMQRVLKPGGRLAILELSTPQAFPLKQLYRLYSTTIIPLAGGWLSGEKQAYRYLPASIRAVPQGKEMTALIERQGFSQVQARSLALGISSLYTGVKNAG